MLLLHACFFEWNDDMFVMCDDGDVFSDELVIELEEILLELMGEILFGLYCNIRHLYILFTTTNTPNNTLLSNKNKPTQFILNTLIE